MLIQQFIGPKIHTHPPIRRVPTGSDSNNPLRSAAVAAHPALLPAWEHFHGVPGGHWRGGDHWRIYLRHPLASAPCLHQAIFLLALSGQPGGDVKFLEGGLILFGTITSLMYFQFTLRQKPTHQWYRDRIGGIGSARQGSSLLWSPLVRCSQGFSAHPSPPWSRGWHFFGISVRLFIG